ncbi:MAG: ParB N-terminal domain-containing protein [Clostridia bacterium]|nr:ParB N-terminal domain-containing protein [Clostridia bacterium]
MAEQGGRLDHFIEEELNRYRGIMVPVKSGVLRRALITKVSCKKLHPNPEDEFCKPEVGPNYQIISNYEQQYRTRKKLGYGYDNGLTYHEDDDSLTVERVRPDGYMILNGHHRWAAAIRSNKRSVPVRIVNLTHAEDILASLSKTSNTWRVTLDLDEVVFQGRKGEAAEKPLSFPWSLLYKQPVRLGIPALFRFLKRNGYDVWVYTSRYISMEYLENYLKAYHTYVSGIVTGMSHKSSSSGNLEKLLRDRYLVTVHIDRNSVLRVSRKTRSFEEYSLSGSAETWSQEIMDIFGAFKHDEQSE